jgi:signal transduction histidine kinase
MRTDPQKPASFRRQLAISVAASTAVILLASAIATAFLVSGWVKGSILTHMDHMVREFARRSVLVYLSHDEAIAKNTAETLRSLPSVQSVAFLDRDYRGLFDDPATAKPEFDRARGEGPPSGQWEDDDHFHFLVPVETRPTDSPFDPASPAYAPVAARLGYVHVALDKAPVHGLTAMIFGINVILALVFGALLVTWLNLRFERLTAPLGALVQTMKRAGGDQKGVRAEITGPVETRDIASVFNQMIERIENHQAILESEIAIRTSELREARDAALTASRTKSEFLSTLTHEIRTPLTAISGHTELTIEELHFIEHAGDAIQRLHMVLDTSRDLRGIMDEILTYAKAEAGKSDITLTTVDLARLVNRVSFAMQPMLLKNGNRLRVTFAGAPLVTTDEGKVFHIVLNLVSNACKFTRNGDIHVLVECRSDTLSIAVADNGIGIPKEQEALIFEPFQQADMGDTREHGGVGLGLAITKRFCEMLGGSIDVESEESVGSTFRVTIPLATQTGRE